MNFDTIGTPRDRDLVLARRAVINRAIGHLRTDHACSSLGRCGLGMCSSSAIFLSMVTSDESYDSEAAERWTVMSKLLCASNFQHIACGFLASLPIDRELSFHHQACETCRETK